MAVTDEEDEQEAMLEALTMYEEAIQKAEEECYGEEDEHTQKEMNAIIKELQTMAEELRAKFTSGNTVLITLDLTVPDDCVAGDVVEVEVEGEMVDVTIPEGLNPGDEFEFTVEVEAAAPTPKSRPQPKPKSPAPAPSSTPVADSSASTSAPNGDAIPEGTPPQARYESYGERSIKLLLVPTDLVQEKKTMAVDAKDLSAVKQKIAERIFYPQADAEHLQLFSVETNTAIATLDDLADKDKLQVTVSADFMPKGSTAATTGPAHPSDPETSPTSSTNHGKRNFLLFLVETDIVTTSMKLKADGVTTLDELREMIVEKVSLAGSCSADQLEIYSTLSKMDVTDLSDLKDKDKIRVTVAAVVGEPEPAASYDFEAARPCLAELFGWLGTRLRQCVRSPCFSCGCHHAHCTTHC